MKDTDFKLERHYLTIFLSKSKGYKKRKNYCKQQNYSYINLRPFIIKYCRKDDDLLLCLGIRFLKVSYCDCHITDYGNLRII